MKSDCLVLQLSENIQGNVFNRPWPYIVMRQMTPSSGKAKQHRHTGHIIQDDDPSKDYFFTLRSIRRENGGGHKPLGFIFMGFKVLNNDQVYCFFIKFMKGYVRINS